MLLSARRLRALEKQVHSDLASYKQAALKFNNLKAAALEQSKLRKLLFHNFEHVVTEWREQYANANFQPSHTSLQRQSLRNKLIDAGTALLTEFGKNYSFQSIFLRRGKNLCRHRFCP